MENFTDIFFSSNLNEQSFYFHCSLLDEETKNNIIQTIINYNGVSFNKINNILILIQKYALSLSSKTILVVNNENSLKKLNNEELIKNFDTLYFYNNNHTWKYKLSKNNNNSKKKILRIITIKSLQIELDYFHKNTFEYFLNNNLPINSNKKTTLALILKNKLEEEKLIFYVFNNSKKQIDNDIPFFHKNAPEGYSYFCSKNEYSQLISFLKKNKKIKKKLPAQEKIVLEPAPNKRHYVCQICKIKFDNYLEHIHSKFHEQNKLNLSDSFLRIKNTFKRIVLYNKEKKEAKEKKEKYKVISYKRKSNYIKSEFKVKKPNGKEDISSNINISENNQNDTTKCDSLFKNNNNSKLRNKNRSHINYVNTSRKKEDDTDITLNDIETILDSIKCRSVNKFGHLKKRKKTDIHKKNFFHENYNYDLQKVTGKIAYFNSLFN